MRSVLQGWIRQAVRSEVASGSVELEALLEGRASSFVHVHSAALLALVTEPAPAGPDACPETLLLDAHRLALLQREFQYEVTAAALLLTASNGLAATKKAADMQARAAVCRGQRGDSDADEMLCSFTAGAAGAEASAASSAWNEPASPPSTHTSGCASKWLF